MHSESDEQFFARQAARHALTLPMAQSARFLNGMLRLVGDSKEVADARDAFIHIRKGARQLEQICGQMSLPLGSEGGERK